MNIKSDYLV